MSSKIYNVFSFCPLDILSIIQNAQETKIWLPGDLWSVRNTSVPPKSWNLPLSTGLQHVLLLPNIWLEDHCIIYCTEKLFLMSRPNGFNNSLVIIFFFPWGINIQPHDTEGVWLRSWEKWKTIPIKVVRHSINTSKIVSLYSVQGIKNMWPGAWCNDLHLVLLGQITHLWLSCIRRGSWPCQVHAPVTKHLHWTIQPSIPLPPVISWPVPEWVSGFLHESSQLKFIRFPKLQQQRNF